MNIPWSGFTKKRKYMTEKDRLQYKDLAEVTGFNGKILSDCFFSQYNTRALSRGRLSNL